MKFGLKGTLMSLGLGLLLVPTMFFPWLQNMSLRHSTPVLNWVRPMLTSNVDQPNCEQELSVIISIYFGLAAVVLIAFSIYQAIKGGNLLMLLVHCMIQFYVLQVPFFIVIARTDYNCVYNPQGMDALYSSTPMVSAILVIFGAIFDWIEQFRKA
jgi:hypothetical protein